jgi:hypothetical protein
LLYVEYEQVLQEFPIPDGQTTELLLLIPLALMDIHVAYLEEEEVDVDPPPSVQGFYKALDNPDVLEAVLTKSSG